MPDQQPVAGGSGAGFRFHASEPRGDEASQIRAMSDRLMEGSGALITDHAFRPMNKHPEGCGFHRPKPNDPGGLTSGPCRWPRARHSDQGSGAGSTVDFGEWDHYPGAHGDSCRYCNLPWPCDAHKLRAALEAARGEIAKWSSATPNAADLAAGAEWWARTAIYWRVRHEHYYQSWQIVSADLAQAQASLAKALAVVADAKALIAAPACNRGWMSFGHETCTPSGDACDVHRWHMLRHSLSLFTESPTENLAAGGEVQGVSR